MISMRGFFHKPIETHILHKTEQLLLAIASPLLLLLPLPPPALLLLLLLPAPPPLLPPPLPPLRKHRCPSCTQSPSAQFRLRTAPISTRAASTPPTGPPANS